MWYLVTLASCQRKHHTTFWGGADEGCVVMILRCSQVHQCLPTYMHPSACARPHHPNQPSPALLQIHRHVHTCKAHHGCSIKVEILFQYVLSGHSPPPNPEPCHQHNTPRPHHTTPRQHHLPCRVLCGACRLFPQRTALPGPRTYSRNLHSPGP